MLFRYSYLLAILCLCSACVSTPQLSRDEQLQQLEKKRQFFDKYLTRTYTDKSKKEILDAAQKLFVLLDPTDVSFTHNEEGFIANRKWQWYAVLAADHGVDQWTVKVTDLPNGAKKVAVTENTLTQYVSQQATYVYGVGVVPLGAAQTIDVNHYNEEKALYTLFFRRLDYLLGLNKTWPVCDDFKAEMDKNSDLKGDVSQLCGVLAKNDLPEELRSEK